MKLKIFCLFAVLFAARYVFAQNTAADLIVINGKVRTMDVAKPIAEAFAVMGNKIVAVGTNAEIQKLRGANTRTIDARGRLVVPGFNDAHVHFLEGGYQLSSVDL
ncbi:MAG TPA: amidohydrolase family protein, partial [Pyrinomonadaceae bacterium]